MHFLTVTRTCAALICMHAMQAVRCVYVHACAAGGALSSEDADGQWQLAGPANVPRLVFIPLGVIHGVDAITAGSRIVVKAAVHGEWES
jgi:hypothetical protein